MNSFISNMETILKNHYEFHSQVTDPAYENGDEYSLFSLAESNILSLAGFQPRNCYEIRIFADSVCIFTTIPELTYVLMSASLELNKTVFNNNDQTFQNLFTIMTKYTDFEFYLPPQAFELLISPTPYFGFSRKGRQFISNPSTQKQLVDQIKIVEILCQNLVQRIGSLPYTKQLNLIYGNDNI